MYYFLRLPNLKLTVPKLIAFFWNVITASLIITTAAANTTARPIQYSQVDIVPNPCLSMSATGADNGKYVKNCTIKFGSVIINICIKYSGNTIAIIAGPIKDDASFAVDTSEPTNVQVPA